MKKIFLMAGAALAMMSMVACCGDQKSCTANSGCSNDDDKVFVGVMPAADCDGVFYTLALDYDDDATKGDYKMVEAYLQTDSLAGLNVSASYASEGDFTVAKQGDKTYIKLVKDQKDSAAEASDNVYFIVDSDSQLTMANDSLEVSTTPGLNYSLKLSK